MPSQVFLIYQDCVNCEPMRSWLSSDFELAEERSIEIIKTPFFNKGTPELIRKAAREKITLPFFSDGERVSKHLPALLEGDANDENENDDAAKVKANKKRRKAESEPKDANQ